MRATKVLVLGAGGTNSQGILKALNRSELPVKVYVACIDPLAAGFYISRNEKIMLSPWASDPAFVPWLMETIQKLKVKIVFSGVEEILEVLSRQTKYIERNTNSTVVVSPFQVFGIGQDKLLTCSWLKDMGLPHPAYARADNESAIDHLLDNYDFPFIEKPRTGRSSTDVKKINGIGDIEYHPSMIIQEYLGSDDEEYTVGCFCNQYGMLVESIVFERILKNGTTYVAEAGNFPEVKAAAADIIKKLKPIGPCNIQMRMHNGVPTAFEFNIRYSSATPMRAAMGFNDVEAAIRHFVYGQNDDLGLHPATSGYSLRYVNEVYIDDINKRPGIIENWGA